MRKSGDGTCRLLYLADAVVICIRHIQIPGCVYRNGCGASELRRRPRAIGIPLGRASKGRDDTFGRDLADAVVVSIRHIHIPGCVYRNADGEVQLRGRPRTFCIAKGRTSVCDRLKEAHLSG